MSPALLRGCGSRRDDDIDLEPDELGRDLGIALAAPLRPAILDRDGAALDPTEFAQSLHKSGGPWACAAGVPAPKNPMVGSLPGCCARAASGHAAAVPPRRAMNSRRFNRSSSFAGPTNVGTPSRIAEHRVSDSLQCEISARLTAALVKSTYYRIAIAIAGSPQLADISRAGDAISMNEIPGHEE